MKVGELVELLSRQDPAIEVIVEFLDSDGNPDSLCLGGITTLGVDCWDREEGHVAVIEARDGWGD